jgi:hypothetical protein
MVADASSRRDASLATDRTRDDDGDCSDCDCSDCDCSDCKRSAAKPESRQGGGGSGGGGKREPTAASRTTAGLKEQEEKGADRDDRCCWRWCCRDDADARRAVSLSDAEIERDNKEIGTVVAASSTATAAAASAASAFASRRVASLAAATADATRVTHDPVEFGGFGVTDRRASQTASEAALWEKRPSGQHSSPTRRSSPPSTKAALRDEASQRPAKHPYGEK